MACPKASTRALVAVFIADLEQANRSIQTRRAYRAQRYQRSDEHRWEKTADEMLMQDVWREEYGVEHAPAFRDLEEAHRFASKELRRMVLASALQAGSSERRIEITVQDRIGRLADGAQLFIGRTFQGRLVGRPDLARLGRQD